MIGGVLLGRERGWICGMMVCVGPGEKGGKEGRNGESNLVLDELWEVVII